MRIRAIKPEFYKSERIAALSRDARLLFVGLWGMADSWGVLEDRPRRIRVELLPYDDLVAEQVAGWIDEIVAAGLAVRYAAAGVSYLWMPGFRRHQVGSMPKEERAKAPRLPLPPGVTRESIEAGDAAVAETATDDASALTPHRGATVVPPGDHGRTTEPPQRVSGYMGVRDDGCMGVRAAATPPLTATAICSDPEARWPYVRKETWAVALAAVVDTKIGRNNWPAWARLVEQRGLPAVIAAAEGLPSVARWPNRVEDALPPVVEAPPPDFELGQAAALIRAHGWEACRDAVGFHDAKQIPDAPTLARALDCNRPALRKLLAHYDAQQGAA